MTDQNHAETAEQARERERLQVMLFEAMTGDAPKAPETDDFRDLVLTAYGSDKHGRPRVRAAAEALGVHRSTIHRWIKTSGRRSTPNAQAATQVRSAAKKAQMTTKEGRRQALSTAAKGKKRRGANLTVVGYQGPYDPAYLRQREIGGPNGMLHLTPNQLDDLFGAYVEGGEDAVIQWLQDYLGGTEQNGFDDAAYVEQWIIEHLQHLAIDER